MLFKEELWVDGADSFIQEYCEIVGVNRDSCLEIIINSGCYALPPIMNLKQIMLKNRVFTCPILKYPTTDQKVS